LKSFDMTFPPPAVDLDEIRRKFHAAEAQKGTQVRVDESDSTQKGVRQ
jgi:hypothetical protein